MPTLTSPVTLFSSVSASSITSSPPILFVPFAEVENCILFNDAVIGEGAELKYVILDKDVTATPGAKLIGTKNSPIIVKRGETV
jgi:ADP-glucose pyrophosphorylase